MDSESKWVILKRSDAKSLWETHKHHKGKTFVYKNIDNAIKAMRGSSLRLKHFHGNAKVEREDRAEILLLAQETYDE